MAVAGYSYDENEQKLKINYLGSVLGASIEDYAECMADVIDKILEVKNVRSIVLMKDREYEYGPDQAAMLVGVAKVIEDVVRERLMTRVKVSDDLQKKLYPELSARTQNIVVNLLRRDPIGAYVEVVREIRRIRIKMGETKYRSAYDIYGDYLKNVLEVMRARLEETQLIKVAKPHVAGYHAGDRSLYREIFVPSIRPNFMLTRYMITPPENGKSVKRYTVGDVEVEIFKLPDRAEYFYYVLPPEFVLSEEKYAVLDAARRYMATHQPKTAEFVRTGKIREVFFNIGRDMIREVADQHGVYMAAKELDQLASILTRYTAGLGVLELLLADERVQDVYINSPVESQPILINHAEFEECRTNLIPTQEDAESWATRLRMESGRPLDEANPVLDTDIGVPGGKARFCVITRTLSPRGLGFAIRRHRDRPWTLPLFMKAKAISPLAAGVMSFLIDGTASMLVAGGRGAGKTSVLASLMLEILPKTRIVSIEDSVTGDASIMYENGGEMKSGTVGELVDTMVEKYDSENILGRDILASNPKNVKVFAMDSKGKIRLAPVSRFIRHKVNKEIFEIRTSTGRKISVTEDHSLFSMGEDGSVSSVKSKNLREGVFIVTPRVLNFENRHAKCIDLSKHAEKLGGFYLTGAAVREFASANGDAIKAAGKKLGYSKPGINYWFRTGVFPANVLSVMKPGIKAGSGVSIKANRSSQPIPAIIRLDEDFLKFAGMWLADGCCYKNSVIISVVEREERDVVRRVAEKMGLRVRMHSDGCSLMLNSAVLVRVMGGVLGLKGNAYTKRMPPWAFRLSGKQTGWLLNGFFSGDGCASDKEVVASISSEKLLVDIQTMLLSFGVVLRIGNYRKSDKTWPSRISSLKSLKLFRKHVGFVQGRKMKRLDALCSKVSTHDSSDVIPLPAGLKKRIAGICPSFNKNDYIVRGNEIGREHMKKLLKKIGPGEKELIGKLSVLTESDILWDRITDIKSVTKPQYVYDFSVPGFENFVCNNILAHNTLELPIDQLRDIGYNIESLKSRSVLTMVETEIPADEALRTALRLGDSALVVGEVRSTEAKSLYEAMRIGALSNVVMGTIHGESAYGVFDRVVNDLGVPMTSFKATDIIPICKTLRSADGLHRFRRITEITEVRKKWDKNPDKEGGFVNLFEYSSKEDKLKPTDTLVNGESETLNRIASYVKEWHGDWQAVWENINLRAKIKTATVELSDKLGNPELLEAAWIMKSNAQFHLISEAVRKETGAVDSARVYDQWLSWFRSKIK